LTEPEIVFTDRYQALGIPYPEPGTVCEGQCEGTGFVPVRRDNDDPTLRALWQAAHAEHRGADAILVAIRERLPNFPLHREGCDGTHFVRCPDCDGTGNRRPAK
jgi:hypothetical protein